LHAATIAVVGKVPLKRLWHAVPAYPTLNEVWPAVSRDGRARHGVRFEPTPYVRTDRPEPLRPRDGAVHRWSGAVPGLRAFLLLP